jgi:hypothetical protein
MAKEMEITIRVDTNDADYREETSSISQVHLELLKPLFIAIKNFKPYKSKLYSGKHEHNFPCGECLRDDLGEKSPEDIYGFRDEEMELLEYYLPSCEYGFHTIESVEIFPKPKKERLI